MGKFEYYLEMAAKHNDPSYKELETKYDRSIADLVAKEKEIRKWFYGSNRSSEAIMNSQMRYHYERQWDRALEKAKKSKNWKLYIKDNNLVDSYDFGDVLA